MAAKRPFRLLSVRTKIFFILVGTGLLSALVLGAHHFVVDKPELGPGILFHLEYAARNPASELTDHPPLFLMGIQLFALTIILGFSYLLITWVMLPLAQLHEGVEQIGAGHWDYRLGLGRQDEMGSLAYGFNDLAGRVKRTVEAKEHILVEVSHQLSQPLEAAKQIVEGFGETPTDASLKELSDRLSDMEEMIERLLEASRLHTLNGGIVRATVNLVDATKDVVADYHARGKLLAIVENPPKVMARIDVGRYRILLSNLIDNGLRHSPEGKGVAVAISLQPQRVRIEVRDEGNGIAAGELQKVFEPFYRVRNPEGGEAPQGQKRGFGLGLSLCKRIAEAHGGTIYLESTVGRGTSAIVLLPL